MHAVLAEPRALLTAVSPSVEAGNPVVASYMPNGCNSHWVVHYGFADANPSADCSSLVLTTSRFGRAAPDVVQLLSASIGIPFEDGKFSFALRRSHLDFLPKVMALHRMNWFNAPWTEACVAAVLLHGVCMHALVANRAWSWCPPVYCSKLWPGLSPPPMSGRLSSRLQQPVTAWLCVFGRAGKHCAGSVWGVTLLGSCAFGRPSTRRKWLPASQPSSPNTG